MPERCAVSLQTGEVGYCFPLFVYNTDGTKTPNLKTEIVNKIEEIIGTISPESILDYIYATLHSPKYREKYKEFLKIDFPRIPYPADKNLFQQLVTIGQELRQLHTLNFKNLSELITTFPESGSNKVEKIDYKNGKININTDQYFGNVSEKAWNFYIGGYQPAQKWLKDRKNRILNNGDLEHYQKIIKILVETDRLMNEINKIAL
jgi:predicted helicase